MTADLAASFPTSYAAEWPRVVGATLRAFGDLELAEDSAQEAFLRAAERLTAGESIDNIGAWATTAARRIAISSLGLELDRNCSPKSMAQRAATLRGRRLTSANSSRSRLRAFR